MRRYPNYPLRHAILAIAGICLLLIPASPTLAIYIRHDKPVSSYNSIAANAAFGASGYLADPDWGIAFSSGTLIAPNKVLTAAHVVDENGDLRIDDPAQVKRMSFGTSKYLPSHFTSNIASVSINPAYKGGLAGFDLAILTLKTPITGITPAKLSSINAVGKRAAMIGYGYQGTGNKDGLAGATDKLGAYNIIGKYQDNTFLTDFDNPNGKTNTFGTATPLEYEGTTAAGDSGGPLFADFGNGTWRIVGVLHGGYNDFGVDSHYGDVSEYAALYNPQNISWLKSQGLTLSTSTSATALSAGDLGTLRAIPVPEPSLIGFLIPLTGLLIRRRKN